MGCWAEGGDCKKMPLEMGPKEMMRRAFAEVLMGAGVDVNEGCRSPCAMFFTSYSQGPFHAVCPYLVIC